MNPQTDQLEVRDAWTSVDFGGCSAIEPAQVSFNERLVVTQ